MVVARSKAAFKMQTDSLKTGYLGTRLSGFMGKYTIKKNYGKRCEYFHKQQGGAVFDYGWQMFVTATIVRS